MGSLLEYIKVDVELWEPHDLQMAMYLARMFERHAMTILLVIVQQTT